VETGAFWSSCAPSTALIAWRADLSAAALGHSDSRRPLSSQRNQALRSFSEGRHRVLVATDVALAASM